MKASASMKNKTEERIYVRISHEIKKYLISSGFKEGDRLPSETDLSKVFGVSRATVREAIVALEVAGVLVVRRNVGAIVNNLGEDIMLPAIISEAGPFEQIQVRTLLEPEAARLAATNRTDRQCDEMEKAIEMMVEENQDGFKSETGDMQFHLTIAQASKNSLLQSHIESLWEMRSFGKLWPQLQQSVDINIMRPRAVFQHMRILESIRAKNPEAAKETMIKHLNSVLEELESTIN